MEQLDVIREMIQKKIPYKKVRTVWFLQQMSQKIATSLVWKMNGSQN